MVHGSAYPLWLWNNQMCALLVEVQLAVAPVERNQGPQGTSVLRRHLAKNENHNFTHSTRFPFPLYYTAVSIQCAHWCSPSAAQRMLVRKVRAAFSHSVTLSSFPDKKPFAMSPTEQNLVASWAGEVAEW